MKRIAVAFPVIRFVPFSDLLDYARMVDSLGYDTLFFGESWSRDAFAALSYIAAHTSRIKLGTGIVTVFSRTPAMVAQSIATLDEISGGRAVLGLGLSSPAVIQRWHGIPWEKPIQRTREYIEIIRLALSGQRVDYQGQFFKLNGFRLHVQGVRPNIPIYVAALGPQNVRLTGELADGWLPTYFSLNAWPSFRDVLAQGATAKGRDLASITIAPVVQTAAVDDVARAREAARSRLAFAMGGMGSFYGDMMARSGFADIVDGVRAAFKAGDEARATSLVSDQVLDAFCNVGTPEQCRRKLDDYFAAGVDMPVVNIPAWDDRDLVRRTLQAIAL